MGDRITTEDLRAKVAFFFAGVVDVLVERNAVRGDSYLEMDLQDFATMFRDKGGRIRTAAKENTSNPGVRKELIDACLDEAGYAALLAVWLEHHLGIAAHEWDSVIRRSEKC